MKNADVSCDDRCNLLAPVSLCSDHIFAVAGTPARSVLIPRTTRYPRIPWLCLDSLGRESLLFVFPKRAVPSVGEVEDIESIRFLLLFSVDGQEKSEKADQHPEDGAENSEPE